MSAFLKHNHEVIAVAPDDEDSVDVFNSLCARGIYCETFQLSRGGLNPLQDTKSLLALKALLNRHNPDLLFAYTIKPVIYGGLAARNVGGIRFFPMITGLGYAFAAGGGAKQAFVRAVAMLLYRLALVRAEVVIFQNPDDESLFRDLRLLPNRAPSVCVSGSGVDLEAFPPSELSSAPRFLMLARLIADKGVREYVEAASLVKRHFPDAVFQLAGGLDPNPTGVKPAEVKLWSEQGIIEYLGEVRPVQPLLASCRFYVLPSYYREGTPRSVLEALATGRPIITTDSPGCRETVIHQKNGLLVPPRDAYALARAMIQLLEASDSEVQDMASASLALARDRFDVNKVNNQLLEVMGA